MKTVLAAASIAALALAGSAAAEAYKDYTPQKGAWQITEVNVDMNHIDDYLTGLRTTWVQAAELSKKKGLTDNYWIMVKMDPAGKGANVMLGQHYTSLSALEPDKDRDQAFDKEIEATLSKDKAAAMVAGYDKYRTFVGDGLWKPMDMAK